MADSLTVAPELAKWSGDPLFWRLVYLDRELSEPVGNASIRLAPRGAQELELVTPDGTAVLRVDLPNGARPIFYRRRWLDLTPTGVVKGAGITVFGRAFDAGERFSGQLWAAIAGRFVDCPEGAIDMAMIRLQVEG